MLVFIYPSIKIYIPSLPRNLVVDDRLLYLKSNLKAHISRSSETAYLYEPIGRGGKSPLIPVSLINYIIESSSLFT